MSTVAKRHTTVLVIPAIVFALAACGGGGQGNDGPDSGAPPATPAPSPGTVDTTAPTVPQGVTATAQTSTQVLVSWSASTDAGTGVAGYRVFRNGDSSPIATVQTLNYTDSSVVGNTILLVHDRRLRWRESRQRLCVIGFGERDDSTDADATRHNAAQHTRAIAGDRAERS